MNDDLDISRYLRPGDTVVIGQACAEPPTLVRGFLEAAQHIDGLTALCGYTVGDDWGTATPGRPRIKAYAAHGALRKVDPRQLEMLPEHLSRMEDHIASGRIAADVVLLQVGPADSDGDYDLGLTLDYAAVAAGRARVVLVEVNENMPASGSRRLTGSLVTAAVHTDRALVGSPTRPANDVELQVAERVAALVPDGAAVQLGASALAEAIAAELRSRRGLRVRSGLVGDWLVGLYEAGALAADGPDAVVTTMALGGQKLYEALDDTGLATFVTASELVDPVAVARHSPFMAINSAVEVDLMGQLNAEMAGDRYVGAVGGQVDFFRAAQYSSGGLAIVALASTSPSGASRIVSRLDGVPATSLKSDVDVVVTEWGAADLRGCTLHERAERLAAVAHPDARRSLLDSSSEPPR